MFIQTEPTPNPNTLKFLPGCDVMGNTTASFPDAELAKASPLATRLFKLGGILGVFLGADFISVTKSEGVDWPVLKPAVLGAIMDHYTAGDALVSETPASSGPVAEDDPIVVQIKELLDSRVRPAVANDGGDIIFRAFEDGIVYLHMQGACSGCPSSTATLKHGIENMLRYYIPEVQGVESAD